MTDMKLKASLSVKILYWVSTALVSTLMIFSAFFYITQEQASQGFQHLGFPNYFRIELAIAKIVGVLLILAPRVELLREWAYAGFTITFISALIAHMSSGDPIQVGIAPIVALVVLLTSYFTGKKVRSCCN